MSPTSGTSKRGRRTTAAVLGVVAVAMTGAAFAAVPLYKAFCQATGFGGTPRRASAGPGKVSDREIEVRFDTNVRGIPWTFKAEQSRQKIRLGATNVAYFKVVNNSDQPVTGRAAYNVDPELAGGHLRKLHCFCFDAETLQPHQEAVFPVIYYVDSAFATDPNTRDYGDITLSYTFVQVKTDLSKTVPAQTPQGQQRGLSSAGA